MLRFLTFICCAVLLTSQAHAQMPDLKPIAIPSGLSYQFLGTYTVERLNKILTSELQEFAPSNTITFPAAKNAVDLYRVVYPSVVPEQLNRPTRASGLIAIPKVANKNLPVVMYQHGTVFTKTAVPSFPEESYETRLMIARFAGDGYIVVAADYFGKGLSDEPDSYLVKASTQQACTDMYHTAKIILDAVGYKPSQFFLSGWSQGGWATLVFLNHLENLGIKVTAAVAASAPSDIYTIMNRWINNYEPVDAVYLTGCAALQINAHEFYYNQPGLSSGAFKPEYLQAARDLHANKIGWSEYSKMVPFKIRDMMTESFVKSSIGGETPYWQTLQKTHGYRWRSVTPLRCYHGGQDEVTPSYIAELPAGFQTLIGGGPTQALFAGQSADHRGVFLYSVQDQKGWFESFLK
ncbi:MAG: alpha/beta hydrolase family protein [Ignavibacteria bacterium]|jgi:pimeloyl-ACP methyl ester carboxylesterase